jgi:O-antigen/teichoic acid export membrane protein
MEWRRSLLSIDITGVLILVVGFCVVRPVWRPRFVWSLPIARYFLRFGSRTFVAGLLVQVIDRIDDIWTGHFLGDAALGFYSRAYTFANYPRRVLASPVDSVALATYAEAKGDRRRLSKVFFRVNALMIRTGFLFAGALFLISPEFVRLFLGEKWLPMLNAFRLMIAYTALDPIKYTTGHLFLSIGVPGLLARTRLFQLLILAVGLVTLGPLYGIAGVALAATLMVVIGMGTMLWQARTFVDFSPIRLFAAPVLALVTGGLGAHGLVIAFDAAGSYWQTALIKFVAFVVVYFAVMFLIERRDLYALTQLVLRLLRERKSSEAAWYSVQEDSRT